MQHATGALCDGPLSQLQTCSACKKSGVRSGGQTRPSARVTVRSALLLILLPKSKIEQRRKSRECRFLVISLAATRCRYQYGALWSFLYETMWSLTSSHEQRTSAHKKIRSSVKEDFFNTPVNGHPPARTARSKSATFETWRNVRISRGLHQQFGYRRHSSSRCVTRSGSLIDSGQEAGEMKKPRHSRGADWLDGARSDAPSGARIS